MIHDESDGELKETYAHGKSSVELHEPSGTEDTFRTRRLRLLQSINRRWAGVQCDCNKVSSVL